MSISVENIVNSIKQEIKEEGISVADQYLATKYYRDRMKEYHGQEELILFGMGNYGMLLYQMLQKEGIGYKVKCFCDNGASGKTIQYNNVEVLSPEEAVKKYPNAMIIITPKGYENEILRQLVNLEVSVEKISIFVMCLTGLGE